MLDGNCGEFALRGLEIYERGVPLKWELNLNENKFFSSTISFPQTNNPSNEQYCPKDFSKFIASSVNDATASVYEAIPTRKS